MSFEDGTDYFNLAKELLKDKSSDAKQRTAISRIYFAVFLRARQHLKRKERVFIPKSPQAHTIVRDNFKSDTDDKREEISDILEGLRDQRNSADYDLDWVLTEATLDMILNSANRFFSLITSL
jgi:uncharacterized protein (UPF0332 family)